MSPAATRRVRGRYVIHSVIGTGGMATVYLARQRGAAGFARVVAVKALHPFLVSDPEFARMFIDEARLAARVRHPNVVATIDVIEIEGDLLHVLEWVEGESLARLAPLSAEKKRALVPIGIAASVMCGVLAGLHAAHEAKNERGEPLGLVHRDVSPQNVMVGAADGVARLLDFGVAKAIGRLQTTKDGTVRGKLRYMPAEQLQGKPATRRNDIYGAGVVLWELLTGLPMIELADEGAVVTQVLTGLVEPPSMHRKEVSAELDDVVLRALARDPSDRFETARDMAVALQACVPQATAFEVAEWVQTNAKDALLRRAAMIAEIEAEDVESEPAAQPAAAAPPPSAPVSAEATSQEGTVNRAVASDVPARAAPRSGATPGSRLSRLALALGGLVVAAVAVLAISFVSRDPIPTTAAPSGLTQPPPPSADAGAVVEPSAARSAEPAASAPPPPAASSVSPTPRPARSAPPRPATKRPPRAPTRDGTEDWN